VISLISKHDFRGSAVHLIPVRPGDQARRGRIEVFEYVPYRFDGKQMFAKHVNEAYEGIVSASFGFRQPSFRIYGDTVGIVNAYGSFRGVTKDGKALAVYDRGTLVFVKQSGQWKIVSAHFSAIPKAL
jgi:ketosteroid isomerase-like protein